MTIFIVIKTYDSIELILFLQNFERTRLGYQNTSSLRLELNSLCTNHFHELGKLTAYSIYIY